MNKYYVQSGQIKVVICGPHIKTPIDAACEAMLEYLQEGVDVAPLILISERGFDFFNHDPSENVVLDTEDILKKAGFIFGDE